MKACVSRQARSQPPWLPPRCGLGPTDPFLRDVAQVAVERLAAHRTSYRTSCERGNERPVQVVARARPEGRRLIATLSAVASGPVLDVDVEADGVARTHWPGRPQPTLSTVMTALLSVAFLRGLVCTGCVAGSLSALPGVGRHPHVHRPRRSGSNVDEVAAHAASKCARLS